ncbi:hypothetical protein BD289DRAFT_422067 [Coniella lustricola]|uniref:Ubiquitin-like protease family profile domain-containing protein n=1 Tax=Coniella lustricola TaxID=2025994 RepID=A0A2T3ALI4_9PEZI|nr:hypothetical protein BD289DRAFT_422067 [Coniella lustricola]
MAGRKRRHQRLSALAYQTPKIYIVEGSGANVTQRCSPPSSPFLPCSRVPCASPIIHPSPNKPESPRRNPNTWDPFTRYYSGKNSIPDYGMPRENTMSKIKTKIGSLVGVFRHGDWLDKSSTAQQPEQRPALKRPSDPLAPRPTKRSRHDGRDEHADLLLGDNTASSTFSPRRSSINSHTRESLSVRSSGDAESKKLAMNEYRATTKNITGKKRSRHKKAAERVFQGQLNGDQSSANLSRTSIGYPVKSRLISGREIAGDRIEDDQQITAQEQKVQTKSSSGTAKNWPYTAKRLFPPSSDEGAGEGGDEDEIAELPPATRRKVTAQNHKTRSFEQTNNGKRPSNGPDELQLAHVAKRRSRPANSADIPRTNFVSPTTTGASKEICLGVEAAACDPAFVYPAPGYMRDSAPGATNKKCFLMAGPRSPGVLHPVEKSGATIDELEWIAPSISKIKSISYSKTLPIVKIGKTLDHSTEFPTGAVLIIKFDSIKEAMHFVHFCQQVNSSIRLQGTYGQNLYTVLENIKTKIKERNMKSVGPAVRAAQPQTGAKIPETGPANGKAPSQARVKADVPQPAVSGHYAQVKALRMQMRADDGLEDDSSGATITPSEEKNMHNLIFNDATQDDDVVSKVEPIRPTQRPVRYTRQEQRETKAESQRSLRSSRLEPRSPTPPPQRWTEKHPNWKVDLDYKIPLIYERTTITAIDIERLDEGQFLNDEVISFYAKHLHKQLERRDEQLAKRVYIFSSFFWDTLKSKGYDGVKNWTAKIDLLSFDYIIVPINQSAHWYLAIICKPGGLLPRDRSATPEGDALPNGHTASPQKLYGQNVEDEQHNVNVKTYTITSDNEDDSGKLQDPQASQATQNGRTPTSKKGRGSRRSAGPRKYNPNDPRVITLDSLDGSHTGVSTALKHYLKEEIKHRKGIDIEVPSQFGMTAKDIPFQNNFTDCGVYLLGYIEEFMKDPDEFARNILQHEKRDWNVDAPSLRKKIRDLIFKLHKTYQQEDIRKRRERAEQKRAKSHTPAAESDASRTTSKNSAVTGRLPVPVPTAEERSSPTIVSAQQTQHSNEKSASSAPASRQPTPPRQRSQSSAVFRALKQHSHQQPTREVSPPSLRRQQTSSDQQIEAQEQKHKTHDVNASMIVNPNESLEILEQPRHSQQRVASNIVQSVEIRDGTVNDDSSSTTSSSSDSSVDSVAASTAGEELQMVIPRTYDEAKMLKPLASSSPSRAPPSPTPKDRHVKGRPQPRTSTASEFTAMDATTKFAASKNRQRKKERLFLSESFRRAGARHPSPAEYATVPSSSSSSEMSRKAQRRGDEQTQSGRHRERQREREAGRRQEEKERHVVDLT